MRLLNFGLIILGNLVVIFGATLEEVAGARNKSRDAWDSLYLEAQEATYTAASWVFWWCEILLGPAELFLSICVTRAFIWVITTLLRLYTGKNTKKGGEVPVHTKPKGTLFT